MSYVDEQIHNPELTERERAYFSRIQRVKAMPTLTEVEGNPVNMVFKSMINA